MNTNGRLKNTILNLSTSIVCQVVLLGVKFINRTFFIKTLGTIYLGINGYFSDILAMLSLADLGISSAMNFKMYKPLAENDNQRLAVIMKFYRKSYFAVGVIVFVVGGALIPFLPLLIKDYNELLSTGISIVLIYLIYLFNCSSSYLFFSATGSILSADQKSYIVSVSTLIGTIVYNAVQIGVMIVFKDFILFSVVGVGGAIFVNFLNAIIAKKMYPEVFVKTKESLSKDECISIMKDLFALFLTRINSVVVRSTDNLVLGAFLGMATVGVYSNYILIYNSIKTILSKIYETTKASMGNLFISASIETKKNVFEMFNFLSVILAGVAAVSVEVTADEFIYAWLGEEYVLGKKVVVLLAVEVLVFGYKNSCWHIRNVCGFFKQGWSRPIIGIVINIVVSLILVEPMGIAGVMLGTILADVFSYFIFDPYVIYKFGLNDTKGILKYYISNFIYILLIVLIAFIDDFICKKIIWGNVWISFIAHASICSLSVPLCLVLLFCKTTKCKMLFEYCKKTYGLIRRL